MKKVILGIILLAQLVSASEGSAAPSHTHRMMMLVLQLGLILFAARGGGAIFRKFKLPPVLGELTAGIFIGPFLLGGIPFPGMPHGIFPATGDVMPVSMELYGIATVASIILLFMAGLETDLKLFLKFSVAGSLVGVGGVIASFVVGDITAAYFLKIPYMDPRALFLGVMSTATSVGITVRILSDKKKLDSPEGVTILAGAVIDDILGIILLAIVVGISAVGESASGVTDWGVIALIGAKAIGVWLLFTALGLIFSDQIAKFLRVNGSFQMVSIMGFALALILAGIFEQAGLAMIIGAYVMGLSLSKTDLNMVIQEQLHPVQAFFVPIFFVTMGMLVNVKDIFTKEALVVGSVYTIGAVVAKLIGSGVPALFLNFNKLGAIRIGAGMVPRGEVALIVAGIGLAHGILDQSLFSIAVVMTLITTLVAPVMLSWLISIDGKGTRKDVKVRETGTLAFPLKSKELLDLLQHKVLLRFQGEGFMVHRIEADENLFHIQKDQSLILLTQSEDVISFESALEDQYLIKTLMYEMLVELNTVVEKIKSLAKPEDMKKTITMNAVSSSSFDFSDLFQPQNIIMELNANTKEEVMDEMIRAMFENGDIVDPEGAKIAVLEREAAISTGMQHGVAIPHGRIKNLEKITAVIGFKREGIDFESLDGEPSKVFVLTLIPDEKQVPYVQFLSSISLALSTPEKVEKLLFMKQKNDIINCFKENCMKPQK